MVILFLNLVIWAQGSLGGSQVGVPLAGGQAGFHPGPIFGQIPSPRMGTAPPNRRIDVREVLRDTKSLVGVLCYLLFVFSICAFFIVAMWKIFTKAGEPGWASLVPVYNLLVLARIGGRPEVFGLVYMVPCVGAIFMALDLAKAFGKDVGFAIGLLLLSPIFFPILAFGSAQHVFSRRPRRRRLRDDDEEDSPRRRRPRDDDEEEERPRRRRPVARDEEDDDDDVIEVEEEEDRPRRRPPPPSSSGGTRRPPQDQPRPKPRPPANDDDDDEPPPPPPRPRPKPPRPAQ